MQKELLMHYGWNHMGSRAKRPFLLPEATPWKSPAKINPNSGGAKIHRLHVGDVRCQVCHIYILLGKLSLCMKMHAFWWVLKLPLPQTPAFRRHICNSKSTIISNVKIYRTWRRKVCTAKWNLFLNVEIKMNGSKLIVKVLGNFRATPINGSFFRGLHMVG